MLSSMFAASILALDIHGASLHTNTEQQFNEINPGIGISIYKEDKFYMSGFYKNSYGVDSVYFGVGVKRGRFGLVAGLVSGYPAGVVPMILPRVTIGPLNIHYIPAVNGKYAGPETIMFSTSWAIRRQ